MIIKHIKLHNFRNYGRLDLDVGPSVNIIYGNNAQGKTNLIESINVCSCISSHKTVKDSDLIKFGEKEYQIELTCHDEVYDYDIDLECGYYLENSDLNDGNTPKRELKQDGMKIGKISRYIGVCNTVIFAPEDLNLVKGAPSSRRKYLNMLIMKVSPSYVNLLNHAEKIMKQKNLCLKSFRGNVSKIDNNMLDYWDFSLADLSAEILMYRTRFVNIISSKASKHHSVISGGEEVISVSYSTISGANELLESLLREDDMYDLFMQGKLSEAILSDIKKKLSEFILTKFRNTRENDVEKGIASVGINRDDLEIKLNGISMKLYSSQGQQRSAALSLKLAELEIVKEMVSSSPILLLDDVFSELDAGRRVSLIAGMKEAQIFITCTDREFIENEFAYHMLSDIKPTFFRVENGKVEAES